ncbi:putative disease resistance RPP13-like protein 3, partial [Macadamia integrifolia]|uniref:putative disease resistance RPP13-like protein 3 n=1 Tax=Macadamia integrifolia TaxID=60698 RepID=UPI001C4F6356
MVQRFMGYRKHLFTQHKLGKQMEDFKRRIGEISANKSKYGMEAFETGEPSSDHLDDGLARKVRRASMKEEVDVVGFEKDIKELLPKLLTKEDPRQLLVVSIVGMGGLGKTTLAKTVYNRSDVKKIFDSCAWIYVSQEYKIKDLLFGAIAQLMMHKEEELEKKNKEYLKNMLSNYLKQGRCLLVFDDVWRREDWDKLREAFLGHQDDGKQLRVVLTTCNVEVARHADPLTAPHELRHLGEEESFELFSKKVFQYQVGNEESGYSKELKKLGKKLVPRCDGLPLAIVVLGGLLSTKDKKLSVWTKVFESAYWQLNQGPQQCKDILALSYADLPFYLKSCFLYFGLFPEDHEIQSRKLIQLWATEGFVQQRGDQTIEDVAEEYLEELIETNMIQAARIS